MGWGTERIVDLLTEDIFKILLSELNYGQCLPSRARLSDFMSPDMKGSKLLA
jgi:hypothetical protein